MEINRRVLFGAAGAGSLLFLSACTKDEPDPEPTTPDSREKAFDTVEEAVNTDNSFLVFGDADAPDEIMVILDFYSDDSAKFFNEHIDELREIETVPAKKLGVMLFTNDKDEPDPFKINAIVATTAMGILVYLNDPAKFWDYAAEVFNREEPFSTREEVIEVGTKYGIEDNDEVSFEMDATQLLIERMKAEVRFYAPEGTPAMTVNRTTWEGDINNPAEVSEAFNSFIS